VLETCTAKAQSVTEAQNIKAALGLDALKRAHVVIPKAKRINWPVVAEDVRVTVVVTNSEAEARRLCRNGQPAIAIIGASKKAVRKWLRDREANVLEKQHCH
jgi:hypothetical protein